MPKAYSYIRFSSSKQQWGDSTKRQTNLRDEFLKKHPDMELDTSLNMKDEGFSAFNNKHIKMGALGKFLALVEEGKIPKGSFLLVESLDRLSRDKPIDALAKFMGLIEAGITIASLVDKKNHSRDSLLADPNSLMLSFGQMVRANEESEIKSGRLRSAWDDKRLEIGSKRLTARCPYWLKPSEGENGFDLIPDRVEVVKRIFQMSRDGIGNPTIVKILNGENVPRFSEKTNGWKTSYIQKVLSNPAVFGEFRMFLQRDGEMTPVETVLDYYPAIMTREEWLITATARSSRKTRGGIRKGKNMSNLFSGLLLCGYCGGPMNMGGYTKKRAGGVVKHGKYIACLNARSNLGCKFIQWEYNDFERLVLLFCKDMDLEQVMNLNWSSQADIDKAMLRLETIKLEIIDMNKRSQALLDAIENSGEGNPLTIIVNRLKEYEGKLDALKLTKQQAEDDIVQLTNSRVVASNQKKLIVDLMQQLETLEGNDLLLLRIRLSDAIKRIIKKIVTFPGGRWYTKDEIENYRRDLIASDASSFSKRSSSSSVR